jgi:hypothetical protein
MTIHIDTVLTDGSALDWPVPPLLPAIWSELTASETASFIDYINQNQPCGVTIPEVASRIRLTAPRFYPGAHLVEGAIKWSPKHIGVFRMLWTNSETHHGLHFLTGTNPMAPLSIGGLNMRPTLSDDDPQIIDDWLRFFCSTVRGELGPFVLVERASDLEFKADVSAQSRDVIEKAARKIRRLQQDKTNPGYRRAALVRYGSSLFAAKFRILPDGMVRMEDDRLIAENVLVQRSNWQRVWQIIATGPASVDPEVQL